MKTLLLYPLRALCLVLFVVLSTAGCRQKMVDTPRYEPYELSTFFEDSLAMRPQVAGTVAHTYPPGDPDTSPYVDEGATVTGMSNEQHLRTTFPFAVTRRVLERGQQRFNVYCSPCHGRTGYGNGMIVQRGLRPPPSFHTERLRNAPAGHFFSVITNGYGAMYSYAARVAPEDRWAITAYIRALQLSQHAAPGDVPTDRLAEMQRAEAQQSDGQEIPEAP